jgi:hypothetical protein
MKVVKPTLETISESVNDILEVVKTIMNTMATKTELYEFKVETTERFEKIDEKFSNRFDDLEYHVAPYGRRLDRLEDKVRQISTKIGLV